MNGLQLFNEENRLKKSIANQYLVQSNNKLNQERELNMQRIQHEIAANNTYEAQRKLQMLEISNLRQRRLDEQKAELKAFEHQKSEIDKLIRLNERHKSTDQNRIWDYAK